MDSTERFFVECIKKGINNERVSEIPDDLNYQYLIRLCSRHSMSVAVFRALENVYNLLDEKFVSLLNQCSRNGIVKDVYQEYDVNNVLSALEKNGIKYMPLKGWVLKKIYKSSDLRHSSDCDILIDKNDLFKIRRLMKELGLKVFQKDTHHDVFYYKNTKSVIEFHKMLFVGKNFEKRCNFGFEKATLKKGYSFYYEMSNEDFYITMIAHSAYHFAKSGVGVRHIADIFVVKSNFDLDFGYIDAQLKKSGLYRFEKELSKLSDYYFRGETPSEFTEKLSDYVLSSSVLANEKRASAAEVSSKMKNGEIKKSKFRTVFSLIFPPFYNMSFTYPVLKKVPILLPFFYVVRWFRVLFKSTKNVSKLKTRITVDSEDVKLVKEIRDGLEINNLL